MNRDAAIAVDGQPGLAQSVPNSCGFGCEGHQHRGCAELHRLSTPTGVEILRADQSLQQHLPKPHQALGPDQGHIGVGFSGLAARLLPLRFNPVIGQSVQLRIQRFSVLLHGQARQALLPGAGLIPALFKAGRDQFVGEKKGPLRFDALEFRQFLRFVVQSADVLHGRLMPVPQKAFVAVGPTQLPPDPTQGSLHQVLILHGPGWIPHHRQAGTVRFLAG